ncbi:hypothetical protein FCV43_12210 [Vibrio genomosp. F6]|uniref:hypothetical protein n=1 Tax=Vibrio TaxID=662 RepID=UPI0010BDD1A0|nr:MULTISPECIES: hypothetical protein [Vibrio]MDN3695796.1 hypothetical protein [Vibrio cortegadensis]TKF21158.1 hypothetical protein FCV43_12210 [Vibrio genomosp. F6]
MGLLSSICSCVSGACSLVSSAVSNIGRGIVSAATSIASLGVSIAEKVADAIKAVGISLGIIRPEDTMEELGERAMLSDKKPEDFDSINEYIDHLKNNVTFDQETFDSLDEKELLARSSIGASITLKGINEKLDATVTPAFMATVASQDLEANEIVETIKIYKEKELQLEDYELYLNNELTLDETDKHSDALVEAYQKLEPELSFEQIEDKVMGLSK